VILANDPHAVLVIVTNAPSVAGWLATNSFLSEIWTGIGFNHSYVNHRTNLSKISSFRQLQAVSESAGVCSFTGRLDV